jgi:hypothetical protein
MFYGHQEGLMRRNLIIATTVTALILGGFWIKSEITPPSESCVKVYLDYGVLSKATPDVECFTASKKINAVDLLNKTPLKIEYIDFGGDLGKAVCTVNKLPKISCAKMDWTSYWGVFVKHGTNNLNVSSHWNMAQTGLSFIELQPGDALGLVYLYKGKVRYPDDSYN